MLPEASSYINAINKTQRQQSALQRVIFIHKMNCREQTEIFLISPLILKFCTHHRDCRKPEEEAEWKRRLHFGCKKRANIMSQTCVDTSVINTCYACTVSNSYKCNNTCYACTVSSRHKCNNTCYACTVSSRHKCNKHMLCMYSL